MLIGTSLAGIQDIDIKLLNEEIAKHSREFFVSSKKSIELITLSTLIGSEIEIISREEMEQIVNELFSEYSAQ